MLVHSSPYLRHVLTLVVVFSCTVVGGCEGQRLVRAFGDSLIADTGPYFGATTQGVINNAEGMIVAQWEGQPGSTMASHSARAGFPDSIHQPIDVALYSFGTNDAIRFATGQPLSYDAGAASLHALFWERQAVERGANCVVWILPQPTHHAIGSGYTTFMWAFRGYLEGRRGSHTHAGKTYTVRTADWGIAAEADRNTYTYDDLHPNAAGANMMGARIVSAINGCPATQIPN